MITKEKLQHHLDALVDKHHDLELDLMEADAHWEENATVSTIKKQKLKLKDEIEKVRKQILNLNKND